MTRVVDFRVTLPPEEYVSKGQLDATIENSYLENYNRIYTGARGQGTIEAMIGAMDQASVDMAVLQAEWGYGDYRAMNAAVHRIVGQYPGKLVGYCTVNPAEPDDMADVVKTELEKGATGVNLQPFAYRLRCNDKRFYPLYQVCQERRVPVTVHCSVNFSRDRTIDFGRPLYLDEVACDFPELTLVANHGGWPWVTEMVAVAWKHPNVYIEIGAVSPKYIARHGTGWEPLITYGNTVLQDRVLWATDSMLAFDRSLSEARELPLKPDVLEKWLGGNAGRLLDRTN